jgi:putative transposase
MLAFSSVLLSSLACRFRSRGELELEIIALRHQLTVLRRQRPGRARLSALDRLLWIWLYRVCGELLICVENQ